MKVIDKANLTLNPKKFSFGKTEISFLRAVQDETPKKLWKTTLHLKIEVNHLHDSKQ